MVVVENRHLHIYVDSGYPEILAEVKERVSGRDEILAKKVWKLGPVEIFSACEWF